MSLNDFRHPQLSKHHTLKTVSSTPQLISSSSSFIITPLSLCTTKSIQNVHAEKKKMNCILFHSLSIGFPDLFINIYISIHYTSRRASFPKFFYKEILSFKLSSSIFFCIILELCIPFYKL